MIEKLKEIQNKTGKSQETMAREIGVTLNTLNRWMRGKFNPSLLANDRLELFIRKYS